MFVYQTPVSSLNRILSNDESGDFKIIIQIKYSKEENGITIQKQKQIIFKTTVNNARIISKVINDKYRKDQNIKEYVFNVSKLEEIKIEDIIEIVSTLIKERGNQNIQINQRDKRNIYDRIMTILDNEEETVVEYNIIECHYSEDNKFSGIITYLLNKNDGNDEELKLTGGGGKSGYGYNDVSNLLLLSVYDFDKGYMNTVYDRRYAFIEYDFGERKIDMTSYTIRALGRSQYQGQPKTWKFMGSNDHEKWEMIDLRENEDELNKGNFVGHFECVRKGKFYRYIKYIQWDNWYAYNLYGRYKCYRYFIAISAIEFFGSISFPCEV